MLVQSRGKVHESHERVYRFIDQRAKKAIRRAKGGELDDANSTSNRSDCILIDGMATVFESKIQLRHELFNIFLPGRDTTGIALGLMLYNLARDQSVYKKLRQEILAVIPRGAEITFNRLRSVAYLRIL